MSRIFWDTNLFIYLIEGREELHDLVRGLLERMRERRDELLTSTLTLGEVLVKPLEQGPETARRYERFFDAPGVQLVAFDREAARRYAAIRLDRSIRAPDAIQLSCAAAARTNLFLTNDDRLSRNVVPGIDFIAPVARALI